MKKRIIKGIIIYVAGFTLLFLLRFLFVAVTYEGESVPQTGYFGNLNGESQVTRQSDESSSLKLNYASNKRQVQKTTSKDQVMMVTVDQKYEKIAQLRSEARDFEKSDKALRDSIAKNKGVIQFERTSGLPGGRSLEMTIGVLPDLFDTMVSEIKKIAELKSIDINIFDKTSEYREIQSKVLSLEKTRDSLRSLRSRSGKIEELLNLEYKILDIEKEIQQFGVKLGDYNEENELCTIKFNLVENKHLGSGAPIVRLLLGSFEWAIGTYALFTILSFIAILGIWIVILIIDKLKLIEKYVKAKARKNS